MVKTCGEHATVTPRDSTKFISFPKQTTFTLDYDKIMWTTALAVQSVQNNRHTSVCSKVSGFELNK